MNTIKPMRNSDLATIERLGFVEPLAPQLRTNLFTGIERLLCPEAVKLYDFITTSRYMCGKDYTRATWDNARYYFCGKWPNDYFDLLD